MTKLLIQEILIKMSTTTTSQSRLHKISIVCKIVQSPLQQANPVPSPSKRPKGTVFARSEGKRLLLTNDQAKTDIIK